MSARKGVILAGGSGTRLYPATKVISKQLLPVFDRPMIYYPLSTLMLVGIRKILVISTPRDKSKFEELLGDGSQWGIELNFCVQDSPRGLAHAFLVGESFIGDSSSALILGDNIFYGHHLRALLKSANEREGGATIFAYHVQDPERYGVVEFRDKEILSLEEKPVSPKSNYAVTGLYFYDSSVCQYAKSLSPSRRGELEITDLNGLYLRKGNLSLEVIGRGHTWMDVGTSVGLLDAHYFVHTIQKRQGLQIACLEEVALRNKWIDLNQLESIISTMGPSNYRDYLEEILRWPEGTTP